MSRLYFITPGDDLLYRKTFSPSVSVSSFCPPYSAFVVKAIKGLFCRGWGYFCTFSRPCSCGRFWVGSSFFLCVHICSCKIAPYWAVWQLSGPVVWISLCSSLNRWTMYLQAFGSSFHRINQAFVCFIYLFSVTDFISFPMLLNREAGTPNVNLKKA